MGLACAASVLVLDSQSRVPILECKRGPSWCVIARDLCPLGAVGQDFVEEVCVLNNNSQSGLLLLHGWSIVECFGGVVGTPLLVSSRSN